MESVKMTSQSLLQVDKTSLSASKKDLSCLKIVPSKLNQDCVDYLQSEASTFDGGDLQHRAPGRDPDLKVFLTNEDLWQKFFNETTEMVITKPGRRLYPHFQVKIEGLDPDKSYCVILDFVNLDKKRYKYKDYNWTVCGVADPPPAKTYHIHPLSPASGAKWMSKVVSFHKTKITSSSESLEYGKILVHSMHRYQPRVHVVPADDVMKIIPSSISTFSFKITSFVTVTAYQNVEMTKLKVEHNPFAKGFRAGGARIRNSRSSIWTPIEPGEFYVCSHAHPHMCSHAHSSLNEWAHHEKFVSHEGGFIPNSPGDFSPHSSQFQNNLALARSFQLVSHSCSAFYPVSSSNTGYPDHFRISSTEHDDSSVGTSSHQSNSPEEYMRTAPDRSGRIFKRECSEPSMACHSSLRGPPLHRSYPICMVCHNTITNCACHSSPPRFMPSSDQREMVSTNYGAQSGTSGRYCYPSHGSGPFSPKRNPGLPINFDEQQISDFYAVNNHPNSANDFQHHFYSSNAN